MILPRISSYQVSSLPDQTSEWLNRLKEKVEVLEKAAGRSNISNYDFPIASTTQLGGIMVGSGLAITGSGVLSATGGGGSSSYNTLTDKPQINNITLSGNKSFADLGLVVITNNEIDTIINSI